MSQTTTGYEKTLYLIRGLPGAGKDTLGRQLGKVISADQFFTKTVDGASVYEFDASKIHEAHNYCKGEVKDHMEKGYGPLAVCNTFTRLWELAFYIGLARGFSYNLVVLTVESGLTDQELAKRNLHGVPADVIALMRKRWETYGL